MGARLLVLALLASVHSFAFDTAHVTPGQSGDRVSAGDGDDNGDVRNVGGIDGLTGETSDTPCESKIEMRCICEVYSQGVHQITIDAFYPTVQCYEPGADQSDVVNACHSNEGNQAPDGSGGFLAGYMTGCHVVLFDFNFWQ